MKNKKKIKILLLLWHSTDAIAGGFIRLQKFIPYFSPFELTIIDNKPFLVEDQVLHVSFVGYETPFWIKKTYNINFLFGRFFEWIFALFSLLILGWKELAKENYDILYGPTGDNLHIFISGIILKIFFPNVKLVLDVLNLEMPEGSAKNYFNSFRTNGVGWIEASIKTYYLTLVISIERIFIGFVDFVVTVSPYMKKVISHFIATKKIDFTPSGVGVPLYAKQYRNKRKMYDGIFIGRHTKDKGVFDVIKAWSFVVKVKPKARLIMAGSCSHDIKKQLMIQIKKYHLQKNVTLKGSISEKEKWKLLLESRIFLHLAYFEPLVPVITILEALAVGVPAITYEMESLNDYPFLKKNMAFFAIENKNAHKAALAILSVLQDSARISLHRNRAAKKIANMFQWDDIARKEVSILQSVVGGKK